MPQFKSGVLQIAAMRQKYIRCYNFSDLCDSENSEVSKHLGMRNTQLMHVHACFDGGVYFH
jgi:hypothetical protein